MHIYSIIYKDKDGDYMTAIVQAESYFDAEKKAKAYVYGSLVFISVSHIERTKFDAGEVLEVSYI
jgi:hypothetical protein